MDKCEHIHDSGHRIEIRKELFRKSIHVCSASVPLFLRLAYWPFLILLMTIVLVYILSEIARLKGIRIPLLSRITEIASRKRDENKIVLGPVTMALGVIAASLLWRDDCAMIGIFALAFGDGSASLVGKLLGKIKIPLAQGKTVAGSLTCFAAIFLSSYLVCQNAFESLVLATVGMFIEVLPLKDFDNLIIPLVIGGIAHLCF